MQRHGQILWLFPVLAVTLAVAIAIVTDHGHEAEGKSVPRLTASPAPDGQTDLRLMPPPRNVRDLAEARSDLQQALNLLVLCFGTPVDLRKVKSIPVTITAYSSTIEQCDSTPHITASSRPVRVGVLAVSPDLIKEIGISFGQRVLIPGYGLFEVHDLMNPRWHRRVDIWESDREAARLFGKQQGTLIWIEADKESV